MLPVAVLACLFTCAGGAASAQTLSELLPKLISQAAVMAQPLADLDPNTVDPAKTDLSKSFQPGIALTTTPAILNAAIALQLGTYPLGPTAGTVIYSRDGRGPAMHQMFGGAYTDRAVPMGRGKIGLAMTFQNDNFTTFDGVDLTGSGVNFLFANKGPTPDTSDVLQETLSIRLNRKVTSFVFHYGATDRLDLSAVVPIVQVAMDIRAAVRVVRVRSTLDALQSCPGVPARNTGNGPALRLCQDPHGFDNVLTLGSQITFLDVDILQQAAFNNYGIRGKTARGIGDLLLRTKYALVSRPGGALATTIDLSLPSGSKDNFLGSGALRAKAGLAWSAAVGAVSPHASAGYTYSQGHLSSKLQASSPVALDLKVPNEINFGAGLDASIAPRTTLVADVFGRRVHHVQRFDTGSTIFATGSPVVPADVAAASDLIAAGRSDITQLFGIIGGRINLSGSIFANGSVMFPGMSAGLKSKPSAVFSIDYGF